MTRFRWRRSYWGHWLHSSYSRCDRCRDTLTLIAVRNSIVNRRLYTKSTLESVIVLATPTTGINILFICIYIPPSSPLNVYIDFCNSNGEIIELAHYPRNIFIFGDFNLPDFVFALNKPISTQQMENCLHDMASTYSLHQINQVRNHKGVSLDLRPWATDRLIPGMVG